MILKEVFNWRQLVSAVCPLKVTDGYLDLAWYMIGAITIAQAERWGEH